MINFDQYASPSPVDSAQLKRLLNFQGYGRLAAPLWFIGFEEGLGQRDDNPNWSPEAEIRARSLWEPVMDARIASETIGERYWERRDYSQVWNFMAKLARGVLDGEKDWRDREPAHQYVIDQLGRAGGETFLGELMPLPAKDLKTWHFRELFPSREAYEQELRPLRVRMWRDLIAQHRPRIVICYGRGNEDVQRRLYEQIVGGSGEPLNPKSQSLRVTHPHAYVYLMPFLGQGQCSDDDLSEVISDHRRAGAAGSTLRGVQIRRRPPPA